MRRTGTTSAMTASDAWSAIRSESWTARWRVASRLSPGRRRFCDDLCPECAEHFATLRGYLDGLGRAYTINHRLVRGLDYYTKTVFEVWAQGIGAQNAVCGGGRYDGLAEELGGEPTPGIGFGSGIERIVMLLKEQGVTVPTPAALRSCWPITGRQPRLAVCRYLPICARLAFEQRWALMTAASRPSLRNANRVGARSGAGPR